MFFNFGLSFCKLLLIRLSCLKYNRQQETKHRVQAEPRPIITNNESAKKNNFDYLIDPVCTLKHVTPAENNDLGSGKAVVPVDLRKSGRKKRFPGLEKNHVIINDAQLMNKSQSF